MSTIDTSEIKKFADLSARWWDYEGPFRQLHKINRVRVSYIKDILQQLELISNNSLKGLHVLDIGCGGGILSTALSRLGAEVTGLEVAADTISVARHYAIENGLQINYIQSAAEDFAVKGKIYDIVCALEIVEHVADIELFLQSVVKLTKGGGLIFISTLNKTYKSYFHAIFLAECVLRMVPIGTHNWSKFVKPSTIAEDLQGCKLIDMKGMKYRPFMDEWSLDFSVDVNYIMAFKKL